MSSITENPPFPRGSTALRNCGTLTSTMAAQWLGKVVVFPNNDWSASPATPRGGGGDLVYCLVVRNTSGARLLPSFLAQVDTSFNCAGYCATTGGEGFPIDEFLPQGTTTGGGVDPNDLFYVVIQGPARIYLDLATGNGNLLTVGDYVSALTAAASTGATSLAGTTAITAGRIQMEAGTVAALFATTSQAIDYQFVISRARNVIGKAMTAATTNSTGGAGTGKPLIYVTQKWKFG